MAKFLLSLIFSFSFFVAKTQTVEKIFFNLYTDSLKKGTNNYINVEGKFTNGKYLPLTNKEVNFTTSYGTFEGNDLVIPYDYKVDSCVVTVSLKADKTKTITKVIYIKKLEDPDLPAPNKHAPTAKETEKSTSKKKKKKKGK